MKNAILILAICSASFSYAQVGIGTATPSTNSILDVNSANKGLMLPRVSDTSAVANPSAGLLIYNVNAKSPAYHNGTTWRSMTTTATSDSFTYTIANASTGFTNGTFKLESVSNGVSTPGSGAANFQDISLVKARDINSLGFVRAVAAGTGPGSMSIEIKFFEPGSSTPYYSVKGTNIKVTGYVVGGGSGGSFSEQVTFQPLIYGYKDWVSNTSFAWHTGTNSAASY